VDHAVAELAPAEPHLRDPGFEPHGHAHTGRGAGSSSAPARASGSFREIADRRGNRPFTDRSWRAQVKRSRAGGSEIVMALAVAERKVTLLARMIHQVAVRGGRICGPAPNTQPPGGDFTGFQYGCQTNRTSTRCNAPPGRTRPRARDRRKPCR
jgi:hypothetical protein